MERRLNQVERRLNQVERQLNPKRLNYSNSCKTMANYANIEKKIDAQAQQIRQNLENPEVPRSKIKVSAILLRLADRIQKRIEITSRHKKLSFVTPIVIKGEYQRKDLERLITNAFEYVREKTFPPGSSYNIVYVQKDYTCESSCFNTTKHCFTYQVEFVKGQETGDQESPVRHEEGQREEGQ